MVHNHHQTSGTKVHFELPKVTKQLIFVVQRCHPSQGILNTLQLPSRSCSAWRHPEMSLLLCPVALLVPTFSFARGSFVALISFIFQ